LIFHHCMVDICGHVDRLDSKKEWRMYGKLFASLYEGSMVGSGAVVFAVWGYVIAKQEPDREVGSQVRLNPVLLSAILGEEVAEVERAIEHLCAPDGRSSSAEADGRRLVKVGQFDYQVVNGAKYRAIRDEDERRRQYRESKRRARAKVKRGVPLAGEARYEAALGAGDEAEAERIVGEGLSPA
jgi:hypothetical protein